MKVYICGCARGCEEHLEDVFKNIGHLTSFFPASHIVIAYDTSQDKTLLELCKQKKQFPNMDILMMSPGEQLSSIRVENIRNARNRLLRWMRNQLDASADDYFIMLDMDDVCSRPIHMGAIQHAWEHRDAWDALSFTREGDDGYYDIYALSVAPYYWSCWNYSPQPRHVVEQMRDYIQQKLKESSATQSFFPVESAFNGFALYRASAFAGIEYEWEIQKTADMMPKEWLEASAVATQQELTATPNGDDCEHRSFHMRGKQVHGARIFISPRPLFPKEETEADCVLVSSRGLLHACDIHSNTPMSSIGQLYNYDFSKLKDGSSMYVCGTAMPHFVRVVFPQLHVRIVLVTGDCDWSCPTDMFSSEQDLTSFLESDRLIHWYSQNCVHTHHPKLSQLPIGLDYHTMTNKQPTSWGPRTTPIEQERLLFEIRGAALPLPERLCKAYSNFHFAMTTRFAADRHAAIQGIPPECVDYESKPVPRRETWDSQSRYAFVVSPHGNGLDCHRTWEALALGCIPIVKTSPLDTLFSGLPVWIVQEWSDVTPTAMSEKMQEIYAMTAAAAPSDKLTLAYWVDKIRSSN